MERFSLDSPAGAQAAPAIRQALAAAERFAAAEELAGEDAVRLMVVVEEHLANLLNHGAGGRAVSIAGSIAREPGGAVIVEIDDDGAYFDPRRAPPRERPDPVTGGGSGIALIRGFAVIRNYERRGGRNHISMALRPCRNGPDRPHSRSMVTREQWRRFIDHPVVEWGIFAVGVVLILFAPVVGALPGPGGVFVFALGLAMVLKTSRWARRHYVRFKRWQPKAGRWADWGLRRQSAKRREALARERRKAEAEALAANDPPPRPLAVDPAPKDCAARSGD